MVRILKVKELEDRKRLVLARSEMHRQTMKLEIANIRFSAALLKKRFKFFKTATAILGTAAPLAGLAMARKRAKQRERSSRGGMIGKLFAGLHLLSQFKPLLGNLLIQRRASGHQRVRERERGNISQYL